MQIRAKISSEMGLRKKKIRQGRISLHSKSQNVKKDATVDIQCNREIHVIEIRDISV